MLHTKQDTLHNMPHLADEYIDNGILRNKLMLLLDSTGEGFYGIDMDGCCTFINRAGAQMLGYSADELIGRNMHDHIHCRHPNGTHYPEEHCPILLAYKIGQSCRVDDEVFWRSDGTSIPVEYASYPIIEEDNVCGAVITFNDISKRKQAEIELQQAKAELELHVDERTQALSAALKQVRELSAHANSVREEERTRIAREIHDELGSLLIALKLDVNWMARRVADLEPVAKKCETMNRSIETAVVEVGRIITDLRPSILDHQWLIAALEWQAQEFSESTELPCDIQFHIEPDAPIPQGAIAIATFRIFQEILSNVARHAFATRIRISMHLSTTELVMEVEDDGIGASAKALEDSRSYGVMGMRERALHFSGTLRITNCNNAPRRGTLVRLTLPLTNRLDD